MAELEPRFRTYFRSLRISVRAARWDAQSQLADLAEAGVVDHHRDAAVCVDWLLAKALAILDGLELPDPESPRSGDFCTGQIRDPDNVLPPEVYRAALEWLDRRRPPGLVVRAGREATPDGPRILLALQWEPGAAGVPHWTRATVIRPGATRAAVLDVLDGIWRERPAHIGPAPGPGSARDGRADE